MIYAKKLSETQYQKTEEPMADHVLITREEANNFNTRFRNAVSTVNELRQNLDALIEDKRELKRLLERTRNEQDMFVEFVKERTENEFNARHDTLLAMYNDAIRIIGNLSEENNILRSELELEQTTEQTTNGFYFV